MLLDLLDELREKSHDKPCPKEIACIIQHCDQYICELQTYDDCTAALYKITDMLYYCNPLTNWQDEVYALYAQLVRKIQDRVYVLAKNYNEKLNLKHASSTLDDTSANPEINK